MRRLAWAWLVEVANGPRVFGWRQPFRQWAYSDGLEMSGSARRGVVLVHGFFCNRGVWNGWRPRLRKAEIAHVAVDLEPAFAPIGTHAATIDDAVRRVTQASHGHTPVVVAHSMGGLAVRAWLAGERGRLERIHRIVTIGTPHRGTWLARFARAANGREMQVGSAFLGELTRRETPETCARFTCFWSDCDNIVFPSANATLDGADNRAITGWAHVHLVEHPAIFAAAMDAIEAPAQTS